MFQKLILSINCLLSLAFNLSVIVGYLFKPDVGTADCDILFSINIQYTHKTCIVGCEGGTAALRFSSGSRTEMLV